MPDLLSFKGSLSEACHYPETISCYIVTTLVFKTNSLLIRIGLIIRPKRYAASVHAVFFHPVQWMFFMNSFASQFQSKLRQQSHAQRLALQGQNEADKSSHLQAPRSTELNRIILRRDAKLH